MFTGLIEEVGTVASTIVEGGSRRLTINANNTLEDLAIDDSIAVDGCCQTVVARASDSFTVVAVEETLMKTTLGQYKEGNRVNLERPLRVGDRLGGHFVMGHVDCVGTIVRTETRESSWIYWIGYPSEFRKLVIPVGSIAVNGVSLTVAQIDGNSCMVSIIPHTHAMTTFNLLNVGDSVNLEFDMIGKYVLGVGTDKVQT